jgi:Flp pilus assembly protein TadD
MRIIALFALGTVVLSAQSPASWDAKAFSGDPKALAVACANQARSIERKDSRLLAEYGRAYLASGDRAKAEEAFTAAVKSDSKDAETHFLIGYA